MGKIVTVNGGRCRHAAGEAETSGGGWQVVGAGDVQVGGALCRERRWVLGATHREMDMIMN